VTAAVMTKETSSGAETEICPTWKLAEEYFVEMIR
jgi:hypothetical protein